MARRGNVGRKRNTMGRERLNCSKGSDDSDEDYRVDEDEFNESQDEYCSSLAEDESEESLGEYEEEEEEEWVEVKKVKQAPRPRSRKGFQGKKKNGIGKPKRKKVVHSGEDEEEDDDEDYKDDDFDSVKRRKKKRVSYKEEDEDEIEVSYREIDNDEKPRKKSRVSYKEDDNFVDEKLRSKTKFSCTEENEDDDCDHDEDDDYDDDEDDDDEEFLLDEIDGVDDEDEPPVSKKNKIGRASVQDKGIAKRRRRSRNAEVLRNKRKKSIKNQWSRTKARSDHSKKFRDDNQFVQKNKKITGRGRITRKSTQNSDSDFVSSGSSDYEFTISEEEREQVKEASEFCRSLVSSLRSSNSKMTEEELVLPPQRKRPIRKGKEKLEDMKVETGKQVCGICLSEEGKRTVRGTLNSCSHYFCFACIMEWSKVESRCPLCKQRFSNISKTTRAGAEHDVRTHVITVPERDQVYQPSEEEFRGYLDPYEHVLCIECQQGGDDALMLLCDLCDSPAHAYCVGLGHEVPEGNWYCDGCRPTALASSGTQGLNPNVDHGPSNISVGSSPVASVRGTFDLNELYVPDTPSTQGTVYSHSPRYSVGDVQAASSASGAGPLTVLERRRIQRQINQLLTNRSRQSDRTGGMATHSRSSLFGNQVDRIGVLESQHTVNSETMAQQNIHLQASLQDNTALPLHSREIFSPRFGSWRPQVLQNQASTHADHSFSGLPHSEFVGFNARVGLGQGHQQLQPCSSRSDLSTDVSISPFQFRESTTPSRTFQGSQHLPF